MSRRQKTTEDIQLELGKKLQDFYETGYISHKRAIGFSFLKGMAYGAGIVIGGSILIAVLLWVLSVFDTLPFIGPVVETIQQTIDKYKVK